MYRMNRRAKELVGKNHTTKVKMYLDNEKNIVIVPAKLHFVFIFIIIILLLKNTKLIFYFTF